jgi:undecaprenyl-diphosphatase
MVRYLILGVVQGLTEFLPVSSSGHLVLAERLLGLDPPGVLLEAFLHLGTLAAVILLFRSDLAELFRALSLRGTLERRKEIGFLVAGTVPIVAAGLATRGHIDALFGSLRLVGAGWLAVGLLLLLVHRLRRRARRSTLTFADAVAVGIAQAVSIVPGVSRSGVTIGAGMLCGIEPARAARFSFLLSIPALAGAATLSLIDALRTGIFAQVDWVGIALGTAVAFVVGLAAIRFLLRTVARGELWVFGVYCLLVGAAAVLWGGV